MKVHMLLCPNSNLLNNLFANMNFNNYINYCELHRFKPSIFDYVFQLFSISRSSMSIITF